MGGTHFFRHMARLTRFECLGNRKRYLIKDVRRMMISKFSSASSGLYVAISMRIMSRFRSAQRSKKRSALVKMHTSISTQDNDDDPDDHDDKRRSLLSKGIFQRAWSWLSRDLTIELRDRPRMFWIHNTITKDRGKVQRSSSLKLFAFRAPNWA